MAIYQHCDISFQLDGVTHKGTIRIEHTTEHDSARYRAIIESSPLHGTHGAQAESVALALDFLNLAMQAEGADDIVFSCAPA